VLDRPSAERRPLHHVHNILVKLRDELRNEQLASAAGSQITSEKDLADRGWRQLFYAGPAAHRSGLGWWLCLWRLLLCSCRAVRRNSATVLCLSSRAVGRFSF
jgi:hypothetical protein